MSKKDINDLAESTKASLRSSKRVENANQQNMSYGTSSIYNDFMSKHPDSLEGKCILEL